MASPDLSQWFSVRASTAVDETQVPSGANSSISRTQMRAVTLVWMLVDVVTVAIAAGLATYVRRVDLFHYFDDRIPLQRTPFVLLAYLAGFAVILLLVSRAYGLYGPLQARSGMREQQLTIQACFMASLILAGSLYFAREDSISRAVVIATMVSTALLLCMRRAIWRYSLYKRYEKGFETRNVLVIGTGSSGLAIRRHLQRVRHLGFTFKGFIRTGRDAERQRNVEEISEYRISDEDGLPIEVLGNVSELAEIVRRHFIDEIFVTGPCERGVVKRLLAEATSWGVDVRVVPDLYDGLAWSAPVEYVGQFPTMPLHRRQIPIVGLMLKRVLDLLVAFAALVVLSPAMLAMAVAIRLDSKGPIFYCADRIGRKGCTFRCWKFRTMVEDAHALQEQFSGMNERDGVLFKMSRDPRVTRLGKFFRKYSLDELPQFLNVLAGHMSVVGPRPPLAGEVSQYELPHLRRLEVLPGITGLWQVQARQDPSFDQYISLDTAYVDNWSIWLDLKIMTRTVGVVLGGTGT